MTQTVNKVQTLEIDKNSVLEIDLATTARSFNEIITPALHGSLSVTESKINYTPHEDFLGSDFFTYKETNGDNGVIAISVKDPVFKPRARLLIQLGNQLIKNESIALVELVKNSYDADAANCTVEMSNVDNAQYGVIMVTDDGFGMDINTVKNSWMEPGSDNKAKIVQDRIVTPKFKRLPIGEKGIGRFGVHKLGKEIELVTRREGNKEVVVNINWDDFEQHKYLNDAPVSIIEREPQVFKGKTTGTKITIKNLTKPWTRGMVRDVYRAINAISTPVSYDIDEIIKLESAKSKNVEEVFNSAFVIDKPEWIVDIPSWKRVIEYALYYFDIEIKDDTILNFYYEFRPWNTMNLSGRKVTSNDSPIKELLDIMDPDVRKALSLVVPSNTKIGNFRFRGCIFTRDLPLLKLAGVQPQSLKDYLDENGGIRIYRNGIRVYDYGERENDWLALDYRRFNDPGVKISNNLLLASINLDREESKDLIEKTNREGFIDNDAYSIFKKQITYSLKLIELLREVDKRKVDNIFKTAKTPEPVLKSILDLRSVVNEKVKNKELKKELDLYVDRIEQNYTFMNNTLIKTASAGLGWSVYIHEVEKIIAEITKVLKRENGSERLLKLASHLSGLIESYAQILRKTTRGNEDLIKIIDQALFNIEFRLKAHNINIISNYKETKVPTNVKVTRNLFVANIMNLLDNSIYWLDRSKKKEKNVLIDICEIKEGYLSVVIADNGTGFALSGGQMTEPFVSAKPGGMGLGLHIVKEVLEGHSSEISFNELNEYVVPDEFKNGATVILNIKK